MSRQLGMLGIFVHLGRLPPLSATSLRHMYVYPSSYLSLTYELLSTALHDYMYMSHDKTTRLYSKVLG